MAKEKKMTIDDLAAIMKKGFDQMASREDLKYTEERLVRAVSGFELKISSYASSWSRDFEKLHEWVKEIDERLASVEKKR
mgnify:CR=1 FL=1